MSPFWESAFYSISATIFELSNENINLKPVLLVIMDGHSYEPEMCRFLELAPEVPDEVFEDTGVFLEFQKGQTKTLISKWWIMAQEKEVKEKPKRTRKTQKSAKEKPYVEKNR